MKSLNKNQQAFWNFISNWMDNTLWEQDGIEIRPAHYNLPHHTTLKYFRPEWNERTVRRNFQMLVAEGYLFAIEVTGLPTVYTKRKLDLKESLDLVFSLYPPDAKYKTRQIHIEDSLKVYDVKQKQAPTPAIELDEDDLPY